MPKHTIDLNKYREKVFESFNASLSKADDLWYGVIKLTITLATSLLVFTVAFVEKIFPNVESIMDVPLFLSFSWVFLFLSLIMGIVSEIDSSIEHGLSCERDAGTLREIDLKLIQGITTDTVDLPEKYLTDASFTWGGLCISFFFLAVICIMFSFLEKLTDMNILFLIFAVGSGLLLWLTRYLTNKRYPHLYRKE